MSPPGHRTGEFSMARDPTDPDNGLVAFMDYDDSNGIAGCATAHSQDGGRSWAPGAIPKKLDVPAFRPDPWVAFDPSGAAHQVCLHAAGVLYARSSDKGATWTEGAFLPKPEGASGVDKEVIFASSDGVVHVCGLMVPYETFGLAYWRSEDGGDTWNEPAIVAKGQHGCNGIAESPRGSLHLFLYQYALRVATPSDEYTAHTVSSHDGGLTWDPPQLVAHFPLPPAEILFHRSRSPTPPSPSFAADAWGHIFVAFDAWDDGARRVVPRLFRSSDSGASYQPLDAPDPVDAMCVQCNAIHSLPVFNNELGLLGLQVTLMAPARLTTQTVFYGSADRGETWSAPVTVGRTGPTESLAHPRTWVGREVETLPAVVRYASTGPQPAAESSVQWLVARAVPGPIHYQTGGDYWTLVDHPEGFLASWVDTAGGNGVAISSSIVSAASGGGE